MADLNPRIGKNVIETLTLGMYDDARFVFREYVQNSADQIDFAVELKILDSRVQGRIEITVDQAARTISIYDNATGIKSNLVRRFLGDVANSEKDGVNTKGFRGIGRLGGLGYCDKLIFETSYLGERSKSKMILNAKLLREVIENRKDNRDAAGVISLITTIDVEPESQDSHFFSVTLQGVSNQLLLDVNQVRDYLEMVAPVPFSDKFGFKEKIEKNFSKRGVSFDNYSIFLNGAQVFKAYRDSFVDSSHRVISHLLDVGFFQIKDGPTKLLALGWYGISDGLNKILHSNNFERGIRIRKNNIAIGNETSLVQRFQTERTNLRYVGEVHVIGNGFIPNARRDYFNDSKSLTTFEEELEVIFEDFESKLPYIASDLHNRLKDIKLFREINSKYKADLPGFRSKPQQEQRHAEVLIALKKAEGASKKITKILEENQGNRQVDALFESIIGEYEFRLDDEIFELDSQRVYPPYKFSKVTKEQAKILNEVVIFLQTELGYRSADPLIKKLQKQYN